MRITHWVNVAVFVTLVVSGVVILLAHPRLYWGETGYFGDPALIDLPLPVILEHTGWGRSLHFLAAWVLVINGLVYLVGGLASGHFRRRFLPSLTQLHPRHVARDVLEHLKLRAQGGGPAAEYNLLQKLSYLIVVFLLFPVVLLSGLTMSPALTASWPWLFDLFDGRQSARTVHFIAACLLVLFLLVHVLQVFLAGFREEMRAMITGRLRPRGPAR